MSQTQTVGSLATLAVIGSLLLSSFAFAVEGDVKATYDLKAQKKMEARAASSAVNGACVATAVGVREDALVLAHTAQNTAIGAALTVRKTELMAAWNMTDATARRTARDAAWKKFREARKAANRTLQASAKSAHDAFNAATKACGVTYREQAEVSTSVAI